ncbi:MAG TPA: hypothetical protein GX730_09135 [Chloroflexi bacterium]|jgi:hypothetical protein|nr:hypothetical protein [Anaerolineaceae bacterium]HHX09572.1 hypothetical protein [Chloroflexota bacterium]
MIELFMFIPFLKLLVAETDSGNVEQIEHILKNNRIPYRIQTYSLRGVFGRQHDSVSYKNLNLPMYKGASNPTLSYAVYVWKKDFEKASSLIEKE